MGLAQVLFWVLYLYVCTRRCDCSDARLHLYFYSISILIYNPRLPDIFTFSTCVKIVFVTYVLISAGRAHSVWHIAVPA